MSLTERSAAETVYSDEEMLAIWQRAEVALAQNGQAVTVFGSFSADAANAEFINRQVNKYRRRVLYAKGYTGRNAPDFRVTESGTTNNVPDYADS